MQKDFEIFQFNLNGRCWRKINDPANCNKILEMFEGTLATESMRLLTLVMMSLI